MLCRRQATCQAPKPNRTSTPTATNRRPAPSQGRARQPRHRARAGPAGRSAPPARSPTPRPTAGTCSTTTPCSPAPTSPTRSRATTKAAPASPTSPSASPHTARPSSNRSPRKSPTAARKPQLPGVTKEAALQHFAVVLDGQLITVPSIDYTKYPEGIDASNGSEISGGFTLTSAQNLAERAAVRRAADQARADLPLAGLRDARQTGAQPGPARGPRRASRWCACSCCSSTACSAMIAVGGLLIYGIYFFALIKLIPVTLTLPGIAGLILTIGIAADANIVIFERIKEEIRGGRSVDLGGIATGYKRGFAAIVDANVVTFMTAFILFALATAEVKGFAFTLGIGTLVSLFTAVLATQAALGAMGRSQTGHPPGALGASAPAPRLDVRLHGRLEVVLLAVRHDPADRRAGDRRQGPELRHRLQVRHAHPDGVRCGPSARPKSQRSDWSRPGFPNAEVQKITNQSVGGTGYQISTKTLQPEGVKQVEGGARHEVRQRPNRREQGLLLDLDRADVRQNGGQQRGDRDHRLAAGDLRLHRAALRVEVRRAGADRADARPADHGGRVFADGAGSDDARPSPRC